jgi:hypothetical protein
MNSSNISLGFIVFIKMAHSLLCFKCVVYMRNFIYLFGYKLGLYMMYYDVIIDVRNTYPTVHPEVCPVFIWVYYSILSIISIESMVVKPFHSWHLLVVFILYRVFIVWCVLFVCCLTVVPLPPGKTPFAIKIDNNNNNNIVSEHETSFYNIEKWVR